MPVSKEYPQMSSGNHSRCELVESPDGSLVVEKTISLSNYSLQGVDLVKLYIQYRNQLALTYQIPSIYEAELSDGSFFIKEEAIPGKNGAELCKEGNTIELKSLIREIFIPLQSRVICRSNSNKGLLPLEVLVDTKPANVVKGKGRTTPVDFFPPLIVNTTTQKFIHTHSDADFMRVVYSYGDFEVLLGKFYFELQKINWELAKSLSSIFLELLGKFDDQDLVKRFEAQVIEGEQACPSCFYCSDEKS